MPEACEGRSAINKVDLRIAGFVAFLAVAAGVLVVVNVVVSDGSPTYLSWTTLPFLAVAMVAAEHLRVRFRRGEDTDSLTLLEAVLAPLIFFFDSPVVVATVVVAQVVNAVLRRTTVLKGAFAVAQWALAAAAGSLVLDLMASQPFVTLHTVGVLALAMAAIAVVNTVAVVAVMALASGQGLRQVLGGLSPILVSGTIGWAVNLLFGLLFTLAVLGHPIAVALVPLPLVLMYLAYRGWARAQADGRRLAGLRTAAERLSEPLRPLDAIHGYLDAVRASFDCRAAVLVLRQEDGAFVTFESGRPDVQRAGQPRADRPASAIERLLAAQEEPTRLRPGEQGHLARSLVESGWRECNSAPLLDGSEQLGTLVVFDQVGFEGTDTAELAILAALARETAHTLARGRLLEDVMDKQARLDKIISTTSDGIFTLADDGVLLTWNDACARITGYAAEELLGRRDVMRLLSARTSTDRPVDLANWVQMPSLPREVLVTTAGGEQRRLSCSATSSTDAEGQQSLVVVARDVTPAEEFEELREQFHALVEAQAAQRLVVDHLQQAVAPEPPAVEGADIAVAYVASDPASPTGGDLFDWYELPSGELHVAVVDVLGHGVTATKDALTVMHMLRFVALDGTELIDTVARTDELLGAQESDLVATVIVGRYDPRTGLLRVVSGGHPPALLVGPRGEVTQLSAFGGAIGWPGVGSDNVVTVTLDVHDSVLMYTDGLIEARKDIIEGMDLLQRFAAEVAHMPSQQYADELVRRSLAGAERRDDTLALVIRRTRPAQVPMEQRWRLEPPRPEGVRTVRHELARWLMAHQVESDDAVLVTAELLANAASAAEGVVTMSATLHPGRVAIEVSDDGPGVDSVDDLGRRLPDEGAERGRGLYLVRAMSEELSMMSTSEGTLVRVEIPVRGATAEGRRVHGSRTS